MSVKGRPPVEVSLAATRRRRERLQDYVTRNLLDGQRFVCTHRVTCMKSRIEGDAFRSGIMRHVGARFALQLGGKDGVVANPPVSEVFGTP